jgi:hypothetical protein
MTKLIALIAAVTLGVAGLAFANTKSVDDQQEQADNALDIKSASAGHSGRKLKHEVELWDKVPQNFHGQVCTDVQSQRGAPSGQPDLGAFAICIKNKQQDRVDVIQMATGKVKGHAKVKYPDENTVRFVFRKRAIGKPSKYFWRADTFFSSSGKQGDCPKNPQGYSCFDSAPNPGGEKKHQL